MVSVGHTVGHTAGGVSLAHATAEDRRLAFALSRRVLRQSTHTVLRHCCKNGNNVETTFDFVEATFDFLAFDNVASTLLLVWTGLKVAALIRCNGCSRCYD